MDGEDESGFDVAKAELFEAVGHPYRIRIIQALDQGSMGFAELKKKVGMESSGHLAFHLGKLTHLVAMNADGQYALTGEGREALRMIQTVREKDTGGRAWASFGTRRSLVALLIVVMVAFAMVVAAQQLEIASLSARPAGAADLNGKSFWYVIIPLQSLPTDRNTSVLFDGVNFTLIPSYSVISPLSGIYNLTVTSLPNGTETGTPVTFHLLVYPDVQVRFADGKAETMYANQVSSFNNTVNVRIGVPSGLWFSNHLDPQVAILENETTVTLYVSTGH